MFKWSWLLLAALAGAASAKPVRVDAVEVELVADRAAVVPGQPMKLGLRIRHDRQWHTYWRNPGDSGLPTQLMLTLPAGFSAGDIQWPTPERIRVGPLANYGFEGEIVLPVALAVPKSLDGKVVDFHAQAQWLVCKDVCIPGEAGLDLSLPVQSAGAAPKSPSASLFESMASRSPQGIIEAAAAINGTRLSLAFESGQPGRVEFFPYSDDLISNPAPQPLFRIAESATPRYRLEVALVDGVGESGIRKAGFFDAPAGLLVIDGMAREVKAKRVDALPTGVAVANLANKLANADVRPATGAASSSAAAKSLLEPAAGSAAGASGAMQFETLTFWTALVFALAGGLILNLMPCVFPVVGLKVLSFAGHDRRDLRSSRLNACAFAAGVIVSFWALGAVLLGLRAAGEAAGWGLQLQSPAFVVGMALLFVAIGLNLSGVYEFGTRLTQLGGVGAAPARPAPAFAAGALAVLVATPCSAPFMGSALGYTLGQSMPEALAIFTALGVGMAFPYLLLGFIPSWQRWLPKPGRWMESFRQLLAFPMYATAVWLAWVLAQLAGVDSMLGLAMGTILLALSAWIYGRFVQASGDRTTNRTTAGAIAALAALAAAAYLAWSPAMLDAGASADAADQSNRPRARVVPDWDPWSEQRVSDAMAAGRPVFVDFTAAWCVSCQVNEKLVLLREPVAGEMLRRNVLKLRADWTHRDAAITAALARYGRNGVPLYLLFVPGEPVPRVLPELLTSGILLDSLDAVHLAADRDEDRLVRR